MSDKPFSRSPLPPSGAASRTGAAVRPAVGSLRAHDPSAPEREFQFSTADFERVRDLIYRHAGISLSPIKQDMVYSRLARRLRARGDRTFSEYLDRAQREPQEWETFVNSLTTNLTSFFREAHHFEILAERLKKHTVRSPFRIWCSAASTGEEPYSLAITACEAFNSLSPPVHIIATDIDTNVLATAEKGVYGLDRVERLSRERMQRFFLKGTGTQDGYARVRPELQRLIEFRRINLLDKSWPVQGPFDALFCRNVMIYFDKPTQHGILQRFVPLLKQDGLLFAGHSESFLHSADLFRSLGRTVYERADARAR
ncbi:CheR family methyltransferase [Zoogloea sp. LCSB751]|uniref:CheR family methyltransferase n=1 Tax=Zoogloea sp. LCSB751 TaxID=1965277 RepID=UPI0009A49B0F|nr:CheR family methyltransferase [Zoogloea sp. LCSB751]